jgi:hypothetical protein
MSATGPESWLIDGRNVPIASTYYLALPEGLQFTIETPTEKIPYVESDALDEAWPLMKYAFEKGIYTRATVHAVGKGDVAPGRIGVAFFKKEGLETKGMRVALSIGAIEVRLKNGGKGPAQ